MKNTTFEINGREFIVPTPVVDLIYNLMEDNANLKAGLLRDDARHPEGCKCGPICRGKENKAVDAMVADGLMSEEQAREYCVTVPGHQGCCDICNAGGCCKSDDTESEADNG
jgi:hypothetical protein